MADIDAHAIETIVPAGGDEEAALEQTERELDEAIAQDQQDE